MDEIPEAWPFISRGRVFRQNKLYWLNKFNKVGKNGKDGLVKKLG